VRAAGDEGPFDKTSDRAKQCGPEIEFHDLRNWGFSKKKKLEGGGWPKMLVRRPVAVIKVAAPRVTENRAQNQRKESVEERRPLGRPPRPLSKEGIVPGGESAWLHAPQGHAQEAAGSRLSGRTRPAGVEVFLPLRSAAPPDG